MTPIGNGYGYGYGDGDGTVSGNPRRVRGIKQEEV